MYIFIHTHIVCACLRVCVCACVRVYIHICIYIYIYIYTYIHIYIYIYTYIYIHISPAAAARHRGWLLALWIARIPVVPLFLFFRNGTSACPIQDQTYLNTHGIRHTSIPTGSDIPQYPRDQTYLNTHGIRHTSIPIRSRIRLESLSSLCSDPGSDFRSRLDFTSCQRSDLAKAGNSKKLGQIKKKNTGLQHAAPTKEALREDAATTNMPLRQKKHFEKSKT